MLFCGKHLLSISVLFLVVLTFTTGDGESNPKLEQSTGDAVIFSQEDDLGNSSSIKNGSSLADYEWSSNDDYPNDAPINDAETLAPVEAANETKTEPSVSPANLISNDTDLVTEQNAENITSPSESTPASTQIELSSTENNKNNSSETSPAAVENSSISAAPLPTSIGEEESSSTPNTENSTTTTKVPPSDIITQELGDESDYTSTLGPYRPIDSAGVKTWAVVVVSVLISFAAIFTILYFVRGELIRKRKADQQLLRGSISSEGYFCGDGEENSGGKFEL